MTTEPTPTIALPTRLAAFPDPKVLPASVRKTVAEYVDLYDRLETLHARWIDSTSTQARAAADAADVAAQAAAVRQGKPASSAGTPAADRLTKQAEAAEAELCATIAASYTVADEVRAVFAAALENPATSGQDAAAAAVQNYRDAVDALIAARRAAEDALALPRFLTRVAHYAVPTDLPAPIPWEVVRHRMPSPRDLGRTFDTEAPFDFAHVADLVTFDADRLAEHVAKPY